MTKGTKAPVRAARGVGVRQPRVTMAGQHVAATELCLATVGPGGRPCCKPVKEDGIPYCATHSAKGDCALSVVKHPLAGKVLVAARDLPKGYRVPLWGRLLRKKEVPEKNLEWAFDLSIGWFLDPTSCQGSLVQFCPCAGPNEVAVLNANCNGTNLGEKYGYWPFVLTRDVKRRTQLTMQYGTSSKDSDLFFRQRGITRVDVGTKAYPAVRRKNAVPC